MHHMPNNLTSWFSTLKTFITNNYWLLVLNFVVVKTVGGWLDFRRFNIWVALISCQIFEELKAESRLGFGGAKYSDM